MEHSPRIDDILTKCHDHSATAIIQDDVRWSYGNLYQLMINVAGHLVRHNVYTDKIIVLLGNRVEAVAAIMGISYIGGTFVPVGSSVKPHRLAEIINDCGATTIITDESFYPITNVLENTPTLRAVLNIDEFPTSQLVAQSKPAYPGALMYTSGTTGKPKGVICPHDKMMAAVDSINAYLYHTRRDVIASALPLSHGYGLYQIFTVLAEGGAVLLERNFAYPAKVLENIKKYNATGFATVQSALVMIFNQDDWADYLQGLTYLTTAGAALTPSSFEKLRNALPTTEIMPMYGQTECVRVLYYPEWKQNEVLNMNSCGIAIPDTTTYIDLDTGELVVESPHVMDGYWNNPKDTAITFRDGKLYTNDIFSIDENGLHTYVGRNDDVVKVKGERCAPQELDNALMNIDDIDEAASFAVEDHVFGYRFVAFVASRNIELAGKDIMRYCKKNLEAFLLPKEVVMVDKIPKTENGKISRVILRQVYENMKAKQC